MRWLVDESISRIIVEKLRSAGQDVLFVTDLFPSSPDGTIFARAAAERRIVLTQDLDFGNLVHGTLFTSRCGVVLFRLRLRSKPFQWARLNAAIGQYGDGLASRLTIIEDARFRVRLLS